MSWIRKKLDSLAGTIIAVVAGLTSLQLPAFIDAYLQRLGGHLNEARLGLVAVKKSQIGKEPALLEQVVATAQERVDYLEAAQSAIAQAGSFEQPILFFTHMDNDIALATARSFTPALPLDVPSLIFAVLGVVVGWLAWGLIKSPARLFRGKKRPAGQT
ncbi:MAG: DUF2937 family protein [Proteobacteria bacterium]|nr:DUF2937 family protein [Pseudomonadota bacterium]